MTEEEFITKIMQEGGIIDALEYGLKDTDLLAAFRDTALAQAWRALQAKWDQLQRSLDAVQKLLPDDAW